MDLGQVAAAVSPPEIAMGPQRSARQKLTKGQQIEAQHSPTKRIGKPEGNHWATCILSILFKYFVDLLCFWVNCLGFVFQLIKLIR